MAYLDADAILTRVREVVESAAGSLRTIADGTYEGGLYDGLDGDEQSRRALEKPRVEASIGAVERHPASPPQPSNVKLLRVEVELQVVRYLGPDHQLTDSLRDDVKALAARDADVLEQALGYPGNLTQTSAAAPTGLLSGCLRHEGSDPPDVELGAEGGRITTIHRFTGIVQVAPATS